MLDKLIKEFPDAFSYQELPKHEVKRIVDLTINENIYNQIDRYISDKFFERRNNNTSNPFMK
jgi:deoxyhypusine synthase